MKFKKYRRTKIAELRPVTGDELKYGLDSRISLSMSDKEEGRPLLGDMIARNPKNHDDQWLVNENYFKENFEELSKSNTLTVNEAICLLKESVQEVATFDTEEDVDNFILDITKNFKEKLYGSK
jgi:hypothetical protein